MVTASHAQLGFKVEYCQSEARELIQIADVFANIYYSNLITNNSFNDCLKKIRKGGYIAGEFMFPINKWCCYLLTKELFDYIIILLSVSPWNAP